MMNRGNTFGPEGEDAPTSTAEAPPQSVGQQQQQLPQQTPSQPQPMETDIDTENNIRAPEVLEQPVTPPAPVEVPPPRPIPAEDIPPTSVQSPQQQQQVQAQQPTLPSMTIPVQSQPQVPLQQPQPGLQAPLIGQPSQMNSIHHLAMQPTAPTHPSLAGSNLPPQPQHIASPTHAQPQLASPTHTQLTSLSHQVPLLPIAQNQGAAPTLPQPHIPPPQHLQPPLPSPLHPPPPQQGTPSHMLQQAPPPIITPQQQQRAPNNASPYVPPPPQPSTPPPRQVKFENALEFLDQVKLQFQKQPRVYNQFLDIMKDFKSQYIDTPGVIARVTELFKGHKHLILGFNTFLPPGYKIELPEDEKPAPPPPPAQVSAAAQSATRKQPEFDHARNYVKKIKTRFHEKPEVYKAFLEILHTYHKEQHTIKDVFDQVAKLFANHNDLLEEFTQFLPDGGNAPMPGGPQPTTPAPATVAAQSAASARGVKTRPTRIPPKNRNAPPASPVEPAPRPERVVPERRAIKRPARGAARLEETPAKRAAHEDDDLPVRGVDTRSERERERESAREKQRVAPSGNYEELDFFDRVKNTLNNKVLYHEFLKCLNLFSQEIINRAELVLLVKDLLTRFPELFDWFKQFIGFDDHAIAELLDKKEQMVEDNRPWSEIDFTQCKRHGPSYRALPKNYAAAKCSGRTELCQSVLNDHWVSVPTGSEDFTFKNMRKNQYEEMLFKCEDERYELDLVVELNCSAIRALEKIAIEIEKLSEAEANDYKLKTLDILHVRSIERLYGDKGAEIMEGLYANPAIAVPIVVKRLKQKDQEWTKSRREWNKVWHEITEKNYYKSLDHQSFFFKQQEKKNLSPKVLLAEIKMQYAERLREKEAEKEAAATKERRSQRVKDKEKEAKEAKAEQEEDTPKYHLKYTLDNASIFQDISDLMLFTADNADKSFSKTDKEKIETFLKHFLHVFYKLDAAAAAHPAEAGVSVKAEPMDVDKDTATAADKHKEDKRVKQLFYGNNTFYIFFRLFQITYERLAKAKELARISQKAKWNSRPVRPTPTRGANGDFSQPPSPTSPIPSPPHIPTTASPIHTPAEAPAAPPTTSPTSAATTTPTTTTTTTATTEKDRYQSFIDKLYSLLNGATDQTHYEDETRGLLGISSYILFTLDKLIIQLTRQLQALLLSENCSKLLSLYSYESQRPNGVMESVYHMSCAEFLNEERLFAFEFEQYPNTGAFTIQLLDPSSHTPGAKRFVDFSFEPSRYSEYVSSFTRDNSKIDPKSHHVFLLRNQKLNRENPSILNGVVNENNLECRICLSTYRLFYVEDTEDFFYRPKPVRAPATVLHNNQLRNNVSKVLEKLITRKAAGVPNPGAPNGAGVTKAQ